MNEPFCYTSTSLIRWAKIDERYRMVMGVGAGAAMDMGHSLIPGFRHHVNYRHIQRSVKMDSELLITMLPIGLLAYAVVAYLVAAWLRIKL